MSEAKIKEIMVKSIKMAGECQNKDPYEGSTPQAILAVKIFDALYREELHRASKDKEIKSRNINMY